MDNISCTTYFFDFAAFILQSNYTSHNYTEVLQKLGFVFLINMHTVITYYFSENCLSRVESTLEVLRFTRVPDILLSNEYLLHQLLLRPADYQDDARCQYGSVISFKIIITINIIVNLHIAKYFIDTVSFDDTSYCSTVSLWYYCYGPAACK